MNKLKYSIIYAVIRPEISERISVGIITVDGQEINIRYSDKKLNALKYLFSDAKYNYISKTVRNMSSNNSIRSTKDIDYLSRYSNNMINFSQLQTIDLEPTQSNKDWLYRNYVYSR